MKKVLLTTTALALTAGVASAEITFSGKGEAGVYRTAKTAAVAKVAGVGNGAAGKGKYEIVDNAIVFNKTATSVASAATDYVAAVLAVNAAEVVVANQTALDTLADVQADQEAVVAAQRDAELARLNYIHNIVGTAATAAKKAGDMTAYSGYDFNVAVSGASDNGTTFAMGFDMGAGLIADQDDDRAMDAQVATIDTSAMTIGYQGYTIRIGDDKLDDLYDDTQNGDVGIAGSFGDLTFSLVTDMDNDVKEVEADFGKFTAATNEGAANFTAATFAPTAAVAPVYNPTSYSIGYTMGDIAFSMAGTEHDDRGQAAAKMSLTYTVSDALSATFSSDNVGNYKDIGKLSATYKLSDMLSLTASVKDDKDHALNTNTGGKQSQDMSIAYSAGSMAATLATDESSNWWVNAQYDLGGGAQAFTTFDHTEFLVAGVNFAF